MISKKWIAATVTAAVLTLTGCGATVQGRSDPATAPPPPSTSQPGTPTPSTPKTDDQGWYLMKDIQAKDGPYGTEIGGSVTNLSQARSAMFTLTVYKDGTAVYHTSGAAVNVDKGETVYVTFIGTTDHLGPGPFTYGFQVDLAN